VERFLYRVTYTLSDESVTYEPVCVRAADDDVDSAQAEVEAATERFMTAVGATRTLTLVTVTADV
jgi:hypothetical protein